MHRGYSEPDQALLEYMKTITCPVCKRDHALYYYVNSDGTKTLHFLCDKHPQNRIINKATGYSEVRYVNKIHDVPFTDGLDVPTEWSRAYARKQQGKQQVDLLTNDERRSTRKHGQGGFRD